MIMRTKTLAIYFLLAVGCISNALAQGQTQVTYQAGLGQKTVFLSTGTPVANGNHVWIGNSFGGNLARVDINTKQVTLVPFPNPEAHQPYQVSVDKNHNVWTHLWSTDKVAKFNPATSQWTLFDLPNRGTESRHLSLLERDGQPMQIIVPYYRTRKVAVITPRSEADIEALRTQATRP